MSYSPDLKTVLIGNQGDPITYPDGSFYANKRVWFELVKAEGNGKKRVSLFDDVSGEFVVSRVHEVLTDNGGEFVLPLWPNARGVAVETKYRVSFPDFEEASISFLVAVTDEELGKLSFLLARVTGSGEYTMAEMSLINAALNRMAAEIADLRANPPASSQAESLVTADGDVLKAKVTPGDEGAKFIEWEIVE